MNIVLTIAGGSKRFSEAGMETPKWALPFNNGVVVTEVVKGLMRMDDQNNRIFIYCLEEHKNLLSSNLARFLSDIKVSITTTKEITSGQANSAGNCILTNGLDKEQVLIAPGDMIFRNLEKYKFPRDENWLAVSELPGDSWSFAQINQNGKVIRTAEKERISSFASVGLYHFRSGKQFLDLLESGTMTKGENYIAPLYNNLITFGEVVSPIFISRQDFIDLGTPETYMENLQNT
jgi:dTDP-glucose pyrophosphorylase